MHCTALSPALSSPSPAAGHAANMAVLPESRRLSLLLMAACFLLQALSAHAITRHYKFNVRIYRHQTLPHDNTVLSVFSVSCAGGHAEHDTALLNQAYPHCQWQVPGANPVCKRRR